MAVGKKSNIMTRQKANELTTDELDRGRLNTTDDFPLTVRDAAEFLGVSRQTVYAWVERKQIPHFRMMGRNIRFLRSDLEPFRASFKQETGNE